jgi:hypothetical protein
MRPRNGRDDGKKERENGRHTTHEDSHDWCHVTSDALPAALDDRKTSGVNMSICERSRSGGSGWRKRGDILKMIRKEMLPSVIGNHRAAAAAAAAQKQRLTERSA